MDNDIFFNFVSSVTTDIVGLRWLWEMC